MTKKSCCLWWVIALIMVAFVVTAVIVDLDQFGTVQHLSSDGTVKENSIVALAMIVILCGCVVVVSVMLARAEKKVIKAGARAESQGGDPIAPVTQTARSGCGTGLAMLAVLAVASILTALFSLLTGGA